MKTKTVKAPPAPQADPRLEFLGASTIGPELVIDTTAGPLHVRGDQVAQLLDQAQAARAAQ